MSLRPLALLGFLFRSRQRPKFGTNCSPRTLNHDYSMPMASWSPCLKSFPVCNNAYPFDKTQSRQLFQARCMSSSSSRFKSEQDLIDTVEKTSYRLMYVKLRREDKFALSALYMQVSQGPCYEPEPKAHPNPNEIVYWRDWKNLGDMSKETAAEKFMKIADTYV